LGRKGLPLFVLEVFDSLEHLDGCVTVWAFVVIGEPKVINIDKKAEEGFKNFTGGWYFVQYSEDEVEIELDQKVEK
jgi:hypothetical protein